MRVLIFSDIHANLTALEAVISAAGGFDAAWCLGDLVGYGPDPNECVSRIRNLPMLKCILGNHDAAALNQIDTSNFNPEARLAIQWTQSQLTEDSRIFLEKLPEKIEVDHVTLAHGSPRHPVWEYLLDPLAATQSFKFFNTPYCMVGHSHLPMFYSLEEGRAVARMHIPKEGLRLELSPRAILNPGSVGQPRDRDPRAAYAIYDSDIEVFEYHRVAYDIEAIQARMRAASLPNRHIQRLSEGW